MKKYYLFILITGLFTFSTFSQSPDILLNGTVSAEDNQIKNVTDPTENQDAATKNYTDQLIQNLMDQLSLMQNQIFQLQSQQGFFMDQDENFFLTGQYGNDRWSLTNAENVTYRDGTPIPQVTDPEEWASLNTGAWCYYDNDPAKGKLYNWYAVAGIHDNDSSTPDKYFAPEGWHVPTSVEWDTLMINIMNDLGIPPGTLLGQAMASQLSWLSSETVNAPGYNLNQNNLSGFSAIPVGGRYDTGSFAHENKDAIFWSKENIDEFHSESLSIWYNEDAVHYGWNLKKAGCSVRLIKD